MCNEIVRNCPWELKFIPDYFKTKEMCEKAVKLYPWSLEYVEDHFRTEDMCGEAVRREPYALGYVPNWFVTQEVWCFDNNDYFIRWRNVYQKRKAKKASIKEELMPIAWHPSRYWDWCMSEDEKKETEKLWA